MIIPSPRYIGTLFPPLLLLSLARLLINFSSQLRDIDRNLKLSSVTVTLFATTTELFVSVYDDAGDLSKLRAVNTTEVKFVRKLGLYFSHSIVGYKTRGGELCMEKDLPVFRSLLKERLKELEPVITERTSNPKFWLFNCSFNTVEMANELAALFRVHAIEGLSMVLYPHCFFTNSPEYSRYRVGPLPRTQKALAQPVDILKKAMGGKGCLLFTCKVTFLQDQLTSYWILWANATCYKGISRCIGKPFAKIRRIPTPLSVELWVSKSKAAATASTPQPGEGFRD